MNTYILTNKNTRLYSTKKIVVYENNRANVYIANASIFYADGPTYWCDLYNNISLEAARRLWDIYMENGYVWNKKEEEIL
jgi:hypothetical protein